MDHYYSEQILCSHNKTVLMIYTALWYSFTFIQSMAQQIFYTNIFSNVTLLCCVWFANDYVRLVFVEVVTAHINSISKYRWTLCMRLQRIAFLSIELIQHFQLYFAQGTVCPWAIVRDLSNSVVCISYVILIFEYCNRKWSNDREHSNTATEHDPKTEHITLLTASLKWPTRIMLPNVTLSNRNAMVTCRCVCPML